MGFGKEVTDIFQMAKKASIVDNLVKEAELMIAMFVLEHDLPISISDHLTELIKRIGEKPEVSQKITCSRTKCTALIKNVIGPSYLDDTISILQKSKFSLMIDETTDKTTAKHLVLVVRYSYNMTIGF